MGLNFAGLGFAFGAKDNGLGKAQKRYSKGFDDMSDHAGTLGKILSGIRMSNFLEAMSLSQLGKIREGLKGLATDAGQLSTSFEETLLQNVKTTRSMGVNFGMTGKALNQFSQQAQGMNFAIGVSVDEAGKSIKEFNLVTEEMGAVGIKSATDLAKFATVTGQDVSEMRSMFQTMTGVLHMGNKDINGTVGAFQALGESTGDLSGAMKQLPSMIDKLVKHAAVMGKTLSPEDMAKLAKETASAAAGFFDLGYGADTANKLAMDLADKLMEGQKNIANVFAGTESDVGQLLQSLGVATGDINASFDLMKQGPAGFMRGLNGITQTLRDSGKLDAGTLNLMRGHFEKAFGEEGATGIMQMMEQFASKNIAKTMDKVEKHAADLGKTAKEGFVDARSLSEKYQLAQDRFIAKLRSTSKVGARFLADSTKAFEQWGNSLVGASKDEGVLGAVSRKLIEMHQIGAKALLPADLRPVAAAAGTLLTEMAPMLGALHSMGLEFKDLFNPISWLVGGVTALVGWFGALYIKTKSVDKALNQMGQELGIWLTDLPGQVDEAVASLLSFLSGDFAGMGVDISAQTKNFWKIVGQKLVIAAKHLWNVARSIGSGFITALMGSETLDSSNAGPSKLLGYKLGEMFNAAIDWVKKVAWPKAQTFLVGILSDLSDYLDTVSANQNPSDPNSLAGKLGEVLVKVGKLAIGALVNFATEHWGIALIGAFAFAPGATASILGSVASFTGQLLGLLVTSLPNILSAARNLFGAIPGAAEGAATTLGPIVGRITGLVGSALSSVGGLVSSGVAAAGGAGALAAGAAGVAAAGAAGYGAGTLIDMGITKLNGGKSLGESLYDWMNPDEDKYGPAQRLRDARKAHAQREQNKAKATPVPVNSVPVAAPLNTNMDALVAATHAPAWYHNDFRPLFQGVANVVNAMAEDRGGKAKTAARLNTITAVGLTARGVKGI